MIMFTGWAYIPSFSTMKSPTFSLGWVGLEYNTIYVPGGNNGDLLKPKFRNKYANADDEGLILEFLNRFRVNSA